MREPALGFDSNLSSQSSLLMRIRENLLSVWTLPRVVLAATHAANGAPIHLLDDHRPQTRLTGHAGSTLLACTNLRGAGLYHDASIGDDKAGIKE